MFSIPIMKQDFKINARRLLVMFSLQLVSILLAVGICQMKLVEISDIFWDTIPIIILPMILEIILAYELVTRRVEDGTMDFILSTANKPEKVLFTKALFMVISSVLMIALVTVVGISAKVYSLAGYWNTGSYLFLNFGACCLQILISGFCFYIACGAKSFWEYARLAFIIPIVMYLLYLGYYLIEPLFFLQYITVFSLFRQEWYATGYFVRYIGMLVFVLGGVFFFWRGKKAFYSRILNF